MLISTLRYIVGHPLNKGRPVAAISRFVRWQLATRLFPAALAVPYIGDTRLLVQRGMAGATGNVYCGLHEYRDMAFLLHYLRESDLFIDIGANVGSYTVLAAGACGASAVAFEPVKATYEHLRDNIRLNRLEDRVEAHNCGLGAVRDTLLVSTGDDAMNHIVADGGTGGEASETTEIVPLDEVLAGRDATVLKIDVEGYETAVIDGAGRTLSNPSVAAVLMEFNGFGAHYGYDEAALHARILAFGFKPMEYDPATRSVAALDVDLKRGGNILYLRDPEAVLARVQAGPARPIQGRMV